MIGFIGNIIWESEKVLFAKGIFLFCFGEKCMSGRIKEIKKLGLINQFEIEINFIKPDYFKDETIKGNRFTIREASKVLAEGVVQQIL